MASPDVHSGSSGSRRSWSGSFREPVGGVFRRSSGSHAEDDEADLLWAALERLPTYNRMKMGVVRQAVDGEVVASEVDVGAMGVQDRKALIERILATVQEDNERLLQRLRRRIDTVCIELPKIQVRFQDLCIEADAYVGRRALPTLWNAAVNVLEGVVGLSRLSMSSRKRINKILTHASGILRPSRMTLLLGPPGSGKTTLLRALAGKSEDALRVSGSITYCGHELSEFVAQRTCAYIGQHDLHSGELTVRETLDFSGRCLGVGSRYDMLVELCRREREADIKPDPEIDAFMKGVSLEGRRTSLLTDYILKLLGLDICADTMVGDEMRRGISGGQKKRVTTGEMLVGPARALFMDEISTGLDSSTTFQIVKFMKQIVRVMDATVMISLLQPAPETFALFDDVVLLSEGRVVYGGPREKVLEFFEHAGFKCPDRKGAADFLQEVTSRKDQEQYWGGRGEEYRFVSVGEFARLFEGFHVGRRLEEELSLPYDRSAVHPAALATDKYGLPGRELFKACLWREWVLMRRNSFIYVFKTFQITLMSVIALTVFLRTQMHHDTIADGGKYLGALFFSLTNVMFNGMVELSMTIQRLPVFYKQRDFLLYPAWAFALPIWILRTPLSIAESAIWAILTYYPIGFAPAASRFFKSFLGLVSTHLMALGLFRFIASVARTMVMANTFGTFALLLIFVLGGFVLSRDAIEPWWIWGYYISPMMYGLNALAVNEFLDPRWSTPNSDSNIDAPTVGKALLKSRGLFNEEYLYWVSIAALLAFSVLFNVCFILALTYLNPFGNSNAAVVIEDTDKKSSSNNKSTPTTTEMAPMSDNNGKPSAIGVPPAQAARKGMVLPFQPFSLAFNHVNYYVDMPAEMKAQGIEEDRLQLLCDVSSAFRPGVLTALVGVSGAGKSTLMDVLAGRKTTGYTEGSISVSGYPKNQATFARISGYCEQNDIHSPYVTVYESILYSAWLRLPAEVKPETRQMFVEEVLELIEFGQLRDALVGLPGVSGLSTEQRKRLTIAVELVANPSIIFMDEPTSGLDARAAAIVMRTVRNTVDTGRTVVCTIHQPSIDIFESFDELLLMRSGGQVIYAGPLGRQSQKLVEYFEAFPGVPKITDGYNPATWMLENSSPSMEAQLNLDFAELYSKSTLYQQNQQLINELSIPVPGSNDLHFPTKYAQSFSVQCIACFWKQYWSYWKNPPYNAVRYFMTLVIGLIFGTIFWDKGQKRGNQQDLLNLVGAIYAALFFLGATNSNTVQPVVSIERTVFYRERAAGMYSELAYAFSQVCIEVVYVAAQAALFATLLFSMIGFEWGAEKFLWFLYFIFMSLLYFTLYGMMAVALTPGYQFAAIVMSFFFSLWNLFSGFLVYRPSIPIWWRWYYWACPMAWTIYGAMISQLTDEDSIVKVPGKPDETLGAFLNGVFGYKHDFLVWVAVVHVAFVAVFFFVFSFGIKFLNFQKR